MADPKHVEILKEGVKVWNKWREENPSINPDLNSVDLRGNEIRGTALHHSQIDGPMLRGVDLENADLAHAHLEGGDFIEANLTNSLLGWAHCEGAHFIEADMSEANMTDIHLEGALLVGSNLEKTIMVDAKLTNANLFGANLREAFLRDANFEGAYMAEVDLRGCFKRFFLSQFAKEKRRENIKPTRLNGITVLRGANFEKANVEAIKYNRWGRYLGIQVSTCYGSQVFKTFAQGQDYVEEFKEKHGILYWFWLLSADCGRSFWPWACWSAAFALLFAAIFFYGLGPESFKIVGTPADSFQTMIYYSVVTFTTLGFGDVTPITTTAAWWVMAEVVLGYIMLGGLISILANKLARRS